MPSTNEPTRRASGVAAPPSTNIAPQDIAAVLDDLAARIKADGNADILGIWAVARLAAGMNLTCAVAPTEDPEEAVVILGDALVEAVTTAVQNHPGHRHDVLVAVRGVVAVRSPTACGTAACPSTATPSSWATPRSRQ